MASFELPEMKFGKRKAICNLNPTLDSQSPPLKPKIPEGVIEPVETKLSLIPAAAPASQSILVDNSTLYVSGLIGIDADLNHLVGGGAEQETRKAIENLISILHAAGINIRCVVRITLYVTRMSDVSDVFKVFRQYFLEPYPALTVVQVMGLLMDACVQLDVIAHVPKNPRTSPRDPDQFLLPSDFVINGAD